MKPESRATWLSVAAITILFVTLLAGFIITHQPCERLQEESLLEEETLPLALEIVDFSTLLAVVDLNQCIVPPVAIRDVPPELQDMDVIQEKKDAFFKMLFPIILKVNYDILELREEILAGNVDDELYEQFQLSPEDGIERLLKRADIIPPSLVFAQAAIESAWGTSRFALEANNIFGHWTYVPGTGIVPADRPAGATYEVRIFETLKDSVRAYYHNLNTNRAYREFREARTTTKDPLELTRYLHRYSQLGAEYGKRLNSIIRFNDLLPYDDCTLLLDEDVVLAMENGD
ncbi:Lysozyme subfamily 2 [Desulfurispirillum indicum S5]|uniref:Lysozyme subfamily 2 n=1 Tax=Desulfurispirillum indicum (strain ATCC BAA-1389 / DSM 22839 / S5) TaxID=653733 RepID=E6W0Z1_DESIS|nr:glucosaminidase domain-containing protein [Desulfurispirillum indicum]ADU65323.1 Lysozyme subfamily 2 [Desulfurispirillum indicum S5]